MACADAVLVWIPKTMHCACIHNLCRTVMLLAFSQAQSVSFDASSALQSRFNFGTPEYEGKSCLSPLSGTR